MTLDVTKILNLLVDADSLWFKNMESERPLGDSLSCCFVIDLLFYFNMKIDAFEIFWTSGFPAGVWSASWDASGDVFSLVRRWWLCIEYIFTFFHISSSFRWGGLPLLRNTAVSPEYGTAYLVLFKGFLKVGVAKNEGREILYWINLVFSPVGHKVTVNKHQCGCVRFGKYDSGISFCRLVVVSWSVVLLRTSWKFNEHLIALCVCVCCRRRQRSWLRSKLSSEYHFQTEREHVRSCTVSSFVCQCVQWVSMSNCV